MSNNPTHISQKCSAKTRVGTLCQSSPVRGKRRCRMHGGTNNGAPKGNKNAFKHGLYSRKSIQNRKEVNSLIRQYKAFSKEIELG